MGKTNTKSRRKPLEIGDKFYDGGYLSTIYGTVYYDGVLYYVALNEVGEQTDIDYETAEALR